MRLIGIDPGTRIAGYGIVDLESNNKIKAVAAGAWKLKSQAPLEERLANLAIEFRKIVTLYQPTHMCMELAFLAENPKSALFLGHARGVILSEAYQLGLKVTEISATSAKKIISGNGRADKTYVAKAMSALLGFSLADLPNDATDALAIAYADVLRQSNKFKFEAV